MELLLYQVSCPFVFRLCRPNSLLSFRERRDKTATAVTLRGTTVGRETSLIGKLEEADQIESFIETRLWFSLAPN